MDGIFFFWFAWAIWIYATFIMQKSAQRTYLTFFILLLIMFIHQELHVFQLSFSYSFLICLFASYFLVARLSFRIQAYLFVVSLMVTLVYVGFYLLQIYDPVIVMFHSSWMTACFILLIILFLVRDPVQRIIVASIGVSQGDVINSLFLFGLEFAKIIGGIVFFDILSITIFLIVLWNVLEWLIMQLRAKLNPLNELTDAEDVNI